MLGSDLAISDVEMSLRRGGERKGEERRGEESRLEGKRRDIPPFVPKSRSIPGL